MRVAYHRLRTRVVLAVMLAGMLGGCEDLFGPAPAPPPAPAPAPPPAAPPRATHALPPPPPPAPTAPAAPELKVVGLSQDEIQSLLGDPITTADRPPAKVWQYRSGACVVDIYFYLDVGRNAFYALHYDSPEPASASAAAMAGNGHDAADRCLHRVYNAHREP